MSHEHNATPSFLRRYRATLTTLLTIAAIAIWPGLLFPIARAYVEFSFHHPAATPFAIHYPPYVVATVLLWLVPAILIVGALSLRQALGQLRLDRCLRGAHLQPDDEYVALTQEAGIEGRFVVVADSTPFAFCAGFFRPAVYVSSGLLEMLDIDEIEAVLLHEASHLHRRDPLRLFLLNLMHATLAPLPVVETLCERARIGIELAADRAALAMVPVPTLAGAVLKVARAGSLRAQLTVAELSAGEARIDALLGRPVNLAFGRRDLVLTALVLLTIAGVLLHLWSIKLCPICPTL